MVNKKKEETSTLTYDDRRKELKQVKSQISENMTDVSPDMKEDPKLISTVDQRMTVVYTEEGIRLAYKNLANQRTGMEQRISVLKEGLKVHQELSPELKKLKDDIDKITKFAAGEQKRLELEGMEKELKTVKKEFDGLKSTIGSRLKL